MSISPSNIITNGRTRKTVKYGPKKNNKKNVNNANSNKLNINESSFLSTSSMNAMISNQGASVYSITNNLNKLNINISNRIGLHFHKTVFNSSNIYSS